MSHRRRPDRSRSAAAGSTFATVAVFLSSACCVGPLGVVFAWVGLSGTTLLAVESVLGPFRPWVLGATVLALGYAFRATYGGDPSCDLEGEGATGEPEPSRKPGWIHQTVLWSAATLFVLLLYFTYVHPNLDILFGIYL